uniref:Uncharacterized protein n=1 Tax=Geospiza parvula TaxID=87175 RepID=A0A8U8BEX7_GEOPR
MIFIKNITERLQCGPAGLLGAHPGLPACSHSPQQRVQFSCQAEIHICILIISEPLQILKLRETKANIFQ